MRLIIICDFFSCLICLCKCWPGWLCWYLSLHHQMVPICQLLIDFMERKVLKEYCAASFAYSEILCCVDFWLNSGSPPNHLVLQMLTTKMLFNLPPFLHNWNNHIEADFSLHFKWGRQHTITLPYVPSNSQVANIFTKAMASNCHMFLICKLMLFDLSTLI